MSGLLFLCCLKRPFVTFVLHLSCIAIDHYHVIVTKNSGAMSWRVLVEFFSLSYLYCNDSKRCPTEMLLSVSNHNKPHLAAGRARTRRGVQVQVTEPWRRAPPQRCRHCDQRHQSPTHPVAKRPGGRGTDLRQNDNPSPKSERRCWVSLGGLVTSIPVLAKHGFVFFFKSFG